MTQNFFALDETYEKRKLLYELIGNETTFSFTEDSHKAIISHAYITMQTKLFALQNVDKKIVIGLTVGTFFTIASCILPFSFPLAIAGFAYASYHLKEREHAAKDYTAAMGTLTHCCKWALNAEPLEQHVISSPLIKSMVSLLASVTKDMSPLIQGTNLNALRTTIEEAKNNLTFENERLAQDGHKNLHYLMYGNHSGGVIAFINHCSESMQFARNMPFISNLFAGAPSTPAPTPAN